MAKLTSESAGSLGPVCSRLAVGGERPYGGHLGPSLGCQNTDGVPILPQVTSTPAAVKVAECGRILIGANGRRAAAP